ncbi:hypothetical protein ASF23_06330 [Curtobacterium sp. Leaf261]|nr:hypothetical protein ASF23_06330 [Curtobacterium sp. Leaf261]
MSMPSDSQPRTRLLVASSTTSPRASPRISQLSSRTAATAESGASSGPRRSRTRSITALRSMPSPSARTRTASMPTVERSAFVAQASAVAPTSVARSETCSVGSCRNCQSPGPVAVSRAMRWRRSPCSAPSSSCAATSMSSSRRPTPATGSTTRSSIASTACPVDVSTTDALTFAPSYASAPSASTVPEKASSRPPR